MQLVAAMFSSRNNGSTILTEPATSLTPIGHAIVISYTFVERGAVVIMYLRERQSCTAAL
jgi:hypothetical protein